MGYRLEKVIVVRKDGVKTGIFVTLKRACEEYGFNYDSVREKWRGNEIYHRGYLINREFIKR
jgi:hypothetical protein